MCCKGWNLAVLRLGYPISLYLDARERRYVEEFNTSNFVAITKDQMKRMKIALDPFIHYRFSAVRTCRIQSKTCFVESRIWRELSWSCWCIKQKKLGSSDLYNQSKNARDDSDRDIIELRFIIPSSWEIWPASGPFETVYISSLSVPFYVANVWVLATLSLVCWCPCHPKQSCSPF